MIKLDSLSRWQRLAAGDVMTLPGSAVERRIRLNVNSPGRSSIFLVTPDGEPVFLAAPEGRDVVEFAAGGDVQLTTDAADVFFYTSDNEPTFSIIENAEVFTQVANRAPRNADLEHMMYLQQVNMERRLAEIAANMEQKVTAAYVAGRETLVHSDAPGTVATEPLATVPVQTAAPGTGTPVPSSTPSDPGNVATSGAPVDDGHKVSG